MKLRLDFFAGFVTKGWAYFEGYATFVDFLNKNLQFYVEAVHIPCPDFYFKR